MAVLTQTTLSVGDTQRAIGDILATHPEAIIRNDICYATTNRQEAVSKMAPIVDLVLVIGAENSSNCNRLREVAEVLGVTSYMINGPQEVKKTWLDGCSKIGVTSGASTPEILVEEVINILAPDKVTYLTGVDQDVNITLKRMLRE